MSIRVQTEKCTGCTLCLKSCPAQAIKIVDKKAVIDLEKCNLCAACVSACKFQAILIEKKATAAVDINAYKDVWVFAEQRKGVIAPVVFELLGEGRRLADTLGVNLCALLLGNNTGSMCNELICRGADKVYAADASELSDFLDEPYAKVCVGALKKYKPEIFLAGASTVGRSLISRVAVELNTGLTADCTAFDIDKQTRCLLQTRPAFGGNIMATIMTKNHRPQMATVRHKVMKEACVDSRRKGEIIKLELAKESLSSRSSLLKFVADISQKRNLCEADIIVSGGRGLGTGENFKLIEDLAQVLKAAVGASRAAVDAEWINYSHQVGQTGRTVCPKLYIACGISGQIQHLVGMQSSEVIVAINKDPQAPIMSIANYALVGDLFEIIPALIKNFKQVLV